MDEDCTTSSLNQGVENLLAPPGFISRRSFRLKKVEQNANDDSIKTKKTEKGTLSKTSDVEMVEAACRQRPWILFDQNKEDSLEFESTEHEVVNYVCFASIFFVFFVSLNASLNIKCLVPFL